MRFKKSHIIVLAIFSLSFCNNRSSKLNPIKISFPNEKAPVKFVFEKKIEIKDIMYNSVYAWDNNLIVYGFSGNNTIIYEYDKDLQILRTHEFKKGQGLGELGRFPVFILCDKYWYVPDNTQCRISIFDKDFRFIKYLKENQPYPTPIFIDNCKRLLYVAAKWMDIKNMQFFIKVVKLPQMKERVVFSTPPISLYERQKIILGKGSFHYFYHKGKIYYLEMASYTLALLNMKGKPEKTIEVKFKKIPTRRERIKKWLKEYKFHRIDRFTFPSYIYPVSWMLPLAKGFIVVRRKNYSQTCKDFAEGDYYDYKLNPVGKTKVPCFSGIFRLSSGNFFYGNLTRSLSGNHLYLLREDEKLAKTFLEKWRVKE